MPRPCSQFNKHHFKTRRHALGRLWLAPQQFCWYFLPKQARMRQGQAARQAQAAEEAEQRGRHHHVARGYLSFLHSFLALAR